MVLQFIILRFQCGQFGAALTGFALQIHPAAQAPIALHGLHDQSGRHQPHRQSGHKLAQSHGRLTDGAAGNTRCHKTNHILNESQFDSHGQGKTDSHALTRSFSAYLPDVKFSASVRPMLRMTHLTTASFMLLVLLAGIAHNVQHDIAPEAALHVAAETHNNEGQSDSDHLDTDCLLGDITATPTALATSDLAVAVLPASLSPHSNVASRHALGLKQARAPPISL